MRFQTENLTVKPLSASDREAIIDLLTDDTVKRFYMVPEFATREEAGKLFARLLELSHREDRYVAGIFQEGKCIGILNDTDITGPAIELGYAILPAYHNQGYGTQVLAGAIRYLFDHGFREVLTGAFEKNLASLRVMAKCGMTRLSRQEEVSYRGKTHRCVYYSAKQDGKGEHYGKETLV